MPKSRVGLARLSKGDIMWFDNKSPRRRKIRKIHEAIQRVSQKEAKTVLVCTCETRLGMSCFTGMRCNSDMSGNQMPTS